MNIRGRTGARQIPKHLKCVDQLAVRRRVCFLKSEGEDSAISGADPKTTRLGSSGTAATASK